jgi:hypothetical protein
MAQVSIFGSKEAHIPIVEGPRLFHEFRQDARGLSPGRNEMRRNSW